MKFINTHIPDLIVIEPRIFADGRGSFFESYSQRTFEANGINLDFVQDNQSKSDKNVLRGLHFQNAPYDQGKLVRVIKGSVLDVAVDLRKEQLTYGEYFKIELRIKFIQF